MLQQLPHYSLSTIKQLIRDSHLFITAQTIKDTALNYGYDGDDIVQTILHLSESNFYKSMPSEKIPVIWQDLYFKDPAKPDEAFIILQINHRLKKTVIQFKKQ